jgi:hypothetical protein
VPYVAKFFGFFTALRYFDLDLARCCGGLFATTSTARSKRFIASGSNSISGFSFGDFAMTPTVTEEQRRLRINYCNLMDEIKLRIVGAGRALNGDFKLPDQFNVEFVFLQIRFACELIAQACLTAHGDDPTTKNNNFRDAYRADWILKALDSINEEYFPEPGLSVEHPDGSIEFVPSHAEHIKRQELLAIYRKCDNHLHIGTYKNLPNRFRDQPDFKYVEAALPRISGLLNCHRIKLAAPNEELHVAMMTGPDNKVRATLVAPI